MMGERTVMQGSLFYGFSLEDHVPEDHLLRSTGRFVELSGTRAVQLYLGHRNIQHTVLYTQLAADRFNEFWKD
jgi:site-specific recombinase XerC